MWCKPRAAKYTLDQLVAEDDVIVRWIAYISGGGIDLGETQINVPLPIAADFGQYRMIAAVDIQAGQCVYITSQGTLALASHPTLPQGKAAGIATTSTTAGGGIQYVTDTDVRLADWSAATLDGSSQLIPGQTYYMGLNGMIRTSPPSSGYLLVLGTAVYADTLSIELGMLILQS